LKEAIPVAETTRDELLARVRAGRDHWRSIVDEVGRERMNEPGPMGEWTFKDLAGHLAGWRNWRISLLEAAGRGEPAPASPWPSELDDDDRINDWIHERDRDRSLDDVLADYDSSFDRLADALEALPESALTDPNYFEWTGGDPLMGGDFLGHLRDEHEPAIREWLANRR
jgi:uncharacterized protein (TIGR03083 family)